MADYRDVLGWPVGEDADSITVQLGCGVGAVEFPAGRRICRVYLAARFYLHQPDDMLLRRLADELDQPDLSARDAPAVSAPSGSPSGGSRRPAPDHGGDRGERPERPRPRRAPPDDTAPLSKRAATDRSEAMSEHPEGWRRAAACATAPDPDRFVAPSTPNRDAALLAAEFCAGCPVARPCRAYAVLTRSQGVWGGWWFPTPGTGQAVNLVTAAE